MDEKSVETLSEDIERTLKLCIGDPNGSTYQSLRKLNAKCLIDMNKDLEAAYNLTEALAPSVRTMAGYRTQRSNVNDDKRKRMDIYTPGEAGLNLPKVKSDFLSYLSNETKTTTKDESVDLNDTGYLDNQNLRHTTDDAAEIIKLKPKIQQLPNEWSIVQLTAGYEPCEQWQTLRTVKSTVKYFYITILKCELLSEFNLNPFTFKIVPKGIKCGERGLFEELHLTIEQNHQYINRKVGVALSNEEYWEKRHQVDRRMKSVITTMNKEWLGPWRCLLSGRIPSKIKSAILQKIDGFDIFELAPLQKFLLFKLLAASNGVTEVETSTCLRSIFVDYGLRSDAICDKCGSNKLIHDICPKCDCKSLSKNSKYTLFRKIFIDARVDINSDEDIALKTADKDPLILLIDEKLDTFPWEVLPNLIKSPVTRIECLRMVYAMYEKHASKIVDGFYQLEPNEPRYLINPGGDLHHMEKRMSSFINFWCMDWKGGKNKETQGLYEQYLSEADLFLYCGHGDGSQFAANGIDRLCNVKPVTILSGCNSVTVRYPGPRLLPVPTHSYFHIGNCPCVIGMLWEVTDFEIDKVTSSLISLLVHSENKDWRRVDMKTWSRGAIVVDTSKASPKSHEPNLLKALSIARSESKFTLISSSIVSRGLPVKFI